MSVCVKRDDGSGMVDVCALETVSPPGMDNHREMRTTKDANNHIAVTATTRMRISGWCGLTAFAVAVATAHHLVSP